MTVNGLENVALAHRGLRPRATCHPHRITGLQVRSSHDLRLHGVQEDYRATGAVQLPATIGNQRWWSGGRFRRGRWRRRWGLRGHLFGRQRHRYRDWALVPGRVEQAGIDSAEAPNSRAHYGPGQKYPQNRSRRTLAAAWLALPCPRGRAGRLRGRLRRLALPRPRWLWLRSGRLLSWTAWLRGRVARRRGSSGRWSALRPAPPEPPLGAGNASTGRRMLPPPEIGIVRHSIRQ